MDPVIEPIPLGSFFLVSGIGISLEVAFKRLTGRRVRGWMGRIWTWSFMLYVARLCVRPWIEAGMGGSALTPSSGRWKLGPTVAEWFTQWVIDKVH